MARTTRKSAPAQPLPLPTERWVTRRKAALIAAVRNGEITLEEACRQYQLSPEEFAGWLAAFEKHGVSGLRATRFQIYRDKPRSRTRKGVYQMRDDRRQLFT
jgi:transposase-like protein